MITAKDLAGRLGLSVSTIGRALAEDSRISVETRARVRKMASELGYVSSGPARTVRGGASRLIGLILPSIQHEVYATIAQALSRCCDREQYGLVLSLTDEDPNVELRRLQELSGARVAAAIIMPTAAPRRETVALLNNIPHVQLVRRVPQLGAAWFGIDDEGALAAAVAHLMHLGHRKIAYIGGDERLSTGAARLAGFRRAFRSAGLQPPEAWLRLGPAASARFGSEALFDLLGLADPPTAVVAGSARITAGLMEALTALTIRAPDQISVVGFSDLPGLAWWGPGVSAISVDVEQIATTCGLWLLDRLRATDREPRAWRHSASSPAELILRGSVGPPNRGSS